MVSSVTCKQWVYIIGNLAWFKRSRIRLLCFRFWILRHVHETHVIRSVTFKHEVCVAVGQLLRLRRSGRRLPSRLTSTTWTWSNNRSGVGKAHVC